jgi:hypothetical protein
MQRVEQRLDREEKVVKMLESQLEMAELEPFANQLQ